MGMLIVSQAIYKKSFLDYTLSANGIEHVQKITPQAWIKFFTFQTTLGGGKELITLVFIGFVWCTRSKFFYFLAILTLDKVIVSYYKLIYNNPRPYMVDDNIYSYTCSTSFGNPSGHSSASSVFAVCLMLEIFHGHSYDPFPTKFYSKVAYVITFILLLYWAISIPYTRYLLGAHSLNQVVYGSTLGIWEGIVLHFLVRDNFIQHIMKSLSRQVPKLPMSGGDQKSDNYSRGVDSTQGTDVLNLDPVQTFDPKPFAIITTLFYLSYEILSIITFVIVND